MKDGSIDLSALIQYGVLGIVLLLIITGQLIPKASYEDRKAESAVKDKTIETLQAALDRANERAAASLETSRTTALLLQDLRGITQRSGPSGQS